uniref:Uncharacterized protein n=1 Tax=Arundo donax TaxID=35708 RepID=A0A0A9A7F1_ARUDO
MNCYKRIYRNWIHSIFRNLRSIAENL